MTVINYLRMTWIMTVDLCAATRPYRNENEVMGLDTIFLAASHVLNPSILPFDRTLVDDSNTSGSKPALLSL